MVFKAGRVRDSTMEGRGEFIMRKSDNADVGSGEDYEEALADVGCNADLYVVNQESAGDLLREAHTGDASFVLHRSRPILLSLSVAWSLTKRI